MNIRDWQNGGPTPPGYTIRCSGCRECERDGHLPLNGASVIPNRNPAWAQTHKLRPTGAAHTDTLVSERLKLRSESL